MDRQRPFSAGSVGRSRPYGATFSGTSSPAGLRPTTPVRTSTAGSPTTAFWSGGSPKSDTGVTNDLLDAKLTRKRAESDLQLLANRIALLRSEEQRALQKVAQTQLKADETARIRKRNEDIVKERMHKTLAHENRVRENQIRAQAEREERARKLQMSRQNATDSRRALVQEVLEEKRRLSAVFSEGRNYAEQEKYHKAQEIRQRRQSLREERARQQEEQKRIAQEQYLHKVEVEARRKQQAEGLISRLEREERELIVRLRKTQDLQEKAYTTLQKSMRS